MVKSFYLELFYGPSGLIRRKKYQKPSMDIFSRSAAKSICQKSLLSISSTAEKPIVVDKATQDRTRPSTARVKVILDLLDKHPKRIKLFCVDKDSGKVIEHYQEFVYDNLPRYCIHCKRQGHGENSCHLFLGKDGLKDQNDIVDKGTDVEQYQGDAREIINSKLQIKNNKEKEGQVVPEDEVQGIDKSGEGREAQNNLKASRDVTVDGTVANSFDEATASNSNNEERLDKVERNNTYLENKGKSIETSRQDVVKDGILGSPNAVGDKQGNSIAENVSNDWTLVSHKKNGGSKSSNNQILHQKKSAQIELDRSNDVVECTQFDVLQDENFGQQEGVHGTDELPAEFGNTLSKSQPVTGVFQPVQASAQFDKGVDNLGLDTRDLNKHIEHIDQQAVLTHKKDGIGIEDIAEHREKSASKWADLVEEEEHITSSPRSKLSPQAPEFVPTNKVNPSTAVTNSLFITTKDMGVLAKSHEPGAIVSGLNPTTAYDIGVGNDMSDEDDEDDMLGICFDKVAKEGDLSPRQQRSGSSKSKKKTHGRQHSWDGKVTEEFVPRHLPMRLAKQNHMTVPTTLTRSNKSKK